MPREHVEFIQAADLPWREPVGMWKPAGVKARLLSLDAVTGAMTAEWLLPPGWDHPMGHFGANAEVFILEGSLQTGGIRLQEYSYAYIPTGVNPGPLRSESGCRLLWMPDGAAPFTAAPGHAEGARLNRYIAGLDTYSIPWAGTITPGFPPGAMRKSLRIDPDTGASSWLLGVLPQWQDRRSEIHPVIEEAYQVQGEMDSDRGTFATGCYFWRPAHIPHGPFRTRGGCLTFFRTDGPLVTHYVDPNQVQSR